MSTAFVNAVPVLARSSAPATCLPARPARAVGAGACATRRARVSMKIETEEHKVPEGFTRFSENLNGRAAMVGFVLAVVTEAITGKGIVGQVAQLFKNVDAANVISN